MLSAELGERPAAVRLGEPAYIWQNHSRYVEIVPVRTGWLVVWGRYEEMGWRRLSFGNRVYRDLAGVRRRLADAVVELTHNPTFAAEALVLLDRRGLPPHNPQELPAPLETGVVRTRR